MSFYKCDLPSDAILALPTHSNPVSGSIANFTTSLAKPLTELTSTIVAQQAGTGTPSPSNPRAISGFSSVNLYQRGVNLWDEQWEVGAIDASGNNSTNNNRIRTKGFIKVIPSNTYYIKSPNNIWLWGYDDKKVFKERIPDTSSISNRTITIPSGVYYIRFVVVDAYGTTYNNDISINYPSTDTSYHAYNANSDTFTITLGQTVYGGVLDAKNGKLTITRAGYDLKNYTGSITKVGSGSSTYFRFEDLTPYPDIRTGYFMISDKYEKVVINTTTTAVGISVGKPSTFDHTTIFFRPENPDTYTITTIMDYIINALGGVQVVYDLATPIEITGLTPANFTTFAGEQNIFSDCGDISVIYWQPVKDKLGV